MSQEASLYDEFDLIETKCRGVYEQMYFRIQIRNLDEDVIQMLTIQRKFCLPPNLEIISKKFAQLHSRIELTITW